MHLPVSHQCGSLSKVLFADVALVRPYLGVHENVLVIIAPGAKVLIAIDAVDSRLVLGLVIHQLSRTMKGIPANVTLVSRYVSHEMVL